MSNENSLKQLTAKRSSIKSHLTLFQRYLDNINESNISQNYLEVHTRLDNLIEKQNLFDDIQSEIELMNEHSDEQLVIREEFENRFFKLRAIAKQYLISCETKTVNDSKPLINMSKQTNNCGIKLPAINLPTFDGNYLNWRSFEDSFSAFVDQNDSLTNVQKLCYLRSQLKGEIGRAHV